MIPARLLVLSVLLLPGLWSMGQVSESFDDGNFTADPVWSGSPSDWIVNSAGQLQSNNQTVNSSFYITTPSTLATMAQWEFYIRLNLNTSSANYVDVYLTASSPDLTAATTTGYFVRIGNTQDDICLYRKDQGGQITKIIDGADGITDASNNTLKIKVIRTEGNAFTLYRDLSGTGNNYISEGSTVDATYTTSSFFGILVKQSTSSFFQKHYFDNIQIQKYTPDLVPPSIQSITVLSPSAINVLFSEAVDEITSQNVTSYTVGNNIGHPATAERDASNTALVHLVFNTEFEIGVDQTLTVNRVQDLTGNTIQNATATFGYYTVHPYDVVIDEIMADPNPPVGLPAEEFIELKNLSGRTLNLQGWRLATVSSVSGGFPEYQLPADSFLILCANSHTSDFAQFGRALGIPSFPSLVNEGTTISLLSNEGRTIHAIQYNSSYYDNAVKEQGGWTLEMIDTHQPCGGKNNWKASINPNGGTPGRKNSIDAENPDQTPPQLLRTYSKDSLTLIALFNEPLDSLSAASANNYTLIGGPSIFSTAPLPPLFTSVVLKLSVPLEKSKVYDLSVNNLKDCQGNTIGMYNKAKAGASEEAKPLDVVVNEILFNPLPGGSDYVEIYNRSEKILDAGQLYMANRNSSGAIGSIKKISDSAFFLFPGDYLVLTEDPAALQQQYFVKYPPAVKTMAVMPSFPDDKGYVVITNTQGELIDEVDYSDKWHFALISNNEGVTLERIDPSGPSQDQNNWHSAASTAGYGTPTYRNSQYHQMDNINAAIELQPKIFSPDNDGRDDVLKIHYKVDQSGYVANITIFDADGRLVRYLVKNALLGLTGSWTWNGLNEQGKPLPSGTYIIYSELFNLQGKKKQFKSTVVLAR